jgi:hypothetical protein
MPIKAITKEIFNVGATKLPGRQADVVYYQQRNIGIVRPGTEVG